MDKKGNIRRINGYNLRDEVSRKATEDAYKNIDSIIARMDLLEDELNTLEIFIEDSNGNSIGGLDGIRDTLANKYDDIVINEDFADKRVILNFYSNGVLKRTLVINLVNYAMLSDIPTKVSELENNANFLTEATANAKGFVKKETLDIMVASLQAQINTLQEALRNGETGNNSGDASIPSVIPCNSITVVPETLTMEVGDTRSLNASVLPGNTTDTITWSTNASNIATVSNGTVNAISSGNCVVTATCGLHTDSCSVTVNKTNSVDGIVLSSSIDNTGSTNVTSAIKSAMDSAVRQNKTLIIPRGTYLVSELEFPEGVSVHCEEGSLFLRTVETNTGSFRGALGIYEDNVTITGVLSVDGQGTLQGKTSSTSGTESLPNVLIYNADNITIEEIHSYNSYADGVMISGDGGTNWNGYSSNVDIGVIRSEKCGRKNLVIEHVNNLNIDRAILDNTQGNRTWSGGHCLDVEPWDWGGSYNMPITVHIGYLETTGTGNDLESGLSEEDRSYVVNIDEFVCNIIGGLNTTTNDDTGGDHHEYFTALKCFAITVNIGTMTLNLPSTGHPTWDGDTWGDEQYPSLIVGQYATKVNINTLTVNGGNSNGTLIMLREEEWEGYGGSPELTIGTLNGTCACGTLSRLSGATCTITRNNSNLH